MWEIGMKYSIMNETHVQEEAWPEAQQLLQMTWKMEWQCCCGRRITPWWVAH